jgi:hypothetical protein
MVRGVLLVAVAVVIGVLLMPSGTRPPLAVVTSRTSASVGSSTTTPTHPSTPKTTTTTVPGPQMIHVLVANATTVNGMAGAITTFLGGKGFQTLTAVNATTALSSSQIYYTSGGSAADATVVATSLGLPGAVIQPASSPPPVASSAGASVVVIAGQDLVSRFAPSSSTTS